MNTQPNTPTASTAKACHFCASGRHMMCDGFTLNADTLDKPVPCPCQTCGTYYGRRPPVTDGITAQAAFEQAMDDIDRANRDWLAAKAAHDLAWQQSKGVSGANLDHTQNAVHEAEGDLRAAILDAAKVVNAS